MNIFTEGVPQTVYDMAALRDFRRMRQAEFFSALPQQPATLVMFSLVIPGPVKNNRSLERVFEAGCTAFSNLLNSEKKVPAIVCEDRRAAGCTSFWMLQTNAERIKLLCIDLERKHPLGCLWDFDVFSAFEKKLSSDDTAHPPRSCLICGNPAKVCARNRTHSVLELQEKISTLIHAAF